MNNNYSYFRGLYYDKYSNSPKEYIKNRIYNDYSEKTKSVMDKNKFQDLENNLKKMINEIPYYIEKIKENVKKVEDIYKDEEEQDAINKKIEEIKTHVSDYKTKLENLKLMYDKDIACTEQIHPKQIEDFEKEKTKIEEYKEFINENKNKSENEGENEVENKKIIYWKIPFKNEGISIRYDKNIQIYRGKQKEKYLYFRTEELDNEFKEKFTVEKHNDKNKELNLKDYIFFEKAKKFEIINYDVKTDDELKNIP